MQRIIVDQSGWGQIRVTGGDRVRFLQGMITNDLHLRSQTPERRRRRFLQ